jgi:hypothetical protein
MLALHGISLQGEHERLPSSVWCLANDADVEPGAL